jgi:hypothetical protein
MAHWRWRWFSHAWLANQGLFQLAVLAAAPINARERRPLLFFQRRLTGYAQPNAGNRFAPGLWDKSVAFIAAARALSFRQPASGQLYGVAHTGIDLILDSPIAGPTTSHTLLLFRIILSTGFSGIWSTLNLQRRYLAGFKICALIFNTFGTDQLLKRCACLSNLRFY